MSAKKKTKQKEVEGTIAPKYDGMTGVAFSIECAKDQGFSNFRILTIFIQDGVIEHVEKSQPYGTFEALARAEVYLSHSIWNLSNRFQHGVMQSLGGEERDALVLSLKKKDPELLEKLLPIINNGVKK